MTYFHYFVNLLQYLEGNILLFLLYRSTTTMLHAKSIQSVTITKLICENNWLITKCQIVIPYDIGKFLNF